MPRRPAPHRTPPLPDLEAAIAQIEIEQDDWHDEILDDGVVQMLNNQFEDLVFESVFIS
jgi:hypothetical protein